MPFGYKNSRLKKFQLNSVFETFSLTKSAVKLLGAADFSEFVT